MKELKEQVGDELVVHRSYGRSRHGGYFVAAAYEIVLPEVNRELDADLAQAEAGIHRTGLNPDHWARRPA